MECVLNNVAINGLDKAGNTALYWGCHGGHKGRMSPTRCNIVVYLVPTLWQCKKKKKGSLFEPSIVVVPFTRYISLNVFFCVCVRCGGGVAESAQCGAQPAGEMTFKFNNGQKSVS